MKETKKSLWLCAVSIMLCAVLLIGTTFAWFTDSVTNKGNVIQAGNLDVQFSYRDLMDDAEDDYVNVETAQNKLFENIKWEPGRSFGYDFKVSNEGSLAFDWELSFQNIKCEGGNNVNIADVLDVYVLKDVNAETLDGVTPVTLSNLSNGVVTSGQLTTENPSKTFSVVIKMKETANNDYQDANVAFDIYLRAKQAIVEEDGFANNTYDKNAEYDPLLVSTNTELTEALASGKPVALSNDIALTAPLAITNDITIIGNGNTLTIPDGTDRVINVMNTTEPLTITLKGLDMQGPTTGTYTRGISLYDTKDVTLIMDDCTLSANYYALNVASANDHVKVVVRNSEITGWAAFQTHSPYADITFENCTLKGINDKSYNADGWNGFATIVVNTYSDGNPDPDGAHDCTLTFKNCRIEATQTTGNAQYLLSIRAKNITVNAENCTFFIDGEQIPSTLESVAPHISVYEEALDTFAFHLT